MLDIAKTALERSESFVRGTQWHMLKLPDSWKSVSILGFEVVLGDRAMVSSAQSESFTNKRPQYMWKIWDS